MRAQTRFRIRLAGKVINEVYNDSGMTVEEVKRGLVDHDGYDPDIVVTRVADLSKDVASINRAETLELIFREAISYIHNECKAAENSTDLSISLARLHTAHTMALFVVSLADKLNLPELKAIADYELTCTNNTQVELDKRNIFKLEPEARAWVDKLDECLGLHARMRVEPGRPLLLWGPLFDRGVPAEKAAMILLGFEKEE